jgi:predicted membrane-bound mannosyltransferase
MAQTNGHEASPASSGARWAWIASAVIVAAVLFWAATSNEVYDITSPPALAWHVLLRKAYSIVAFALVGFTADKALGSTARATLRGALLVAAYSAAIEVVQFVRGSHEGIAWNVVDVLCGAAGGWLGVVAGRIIRSRRRA